MRVPRDINGRALAQALARLGYEETRQTGSHIRLTTQRNGEHHVTIPDHRPLRVGTLASVADVGAHFKMSRETLIHELFG